MPDLVVQPLSLADQYLVMGLMDQEEQAWARELDWDFGPIRRILFAFLDQHLLPGFVAMSAGKPVGYTYFLISRSKSIIGTLFTTTPEAQAAAEILLISTIDCLKNNRKVQRIESQVISVHGIDVAATFQNHGFESYLRHYLELDLKAYRPREADSNAGSVVSWAPSRLQALAAAAYRSYEHAIDAVICSDYASEASCESYIRSLVENPGCGIFQASSSFVGLDRNCTPCGFILTSRISNTSAMISQVSIDPAHQGLGLGSALMHHALACLKSDGYKTVRLTVTHENAHAYDWYLRLGFKIRRDFQAYLWQRD